MLELLLHSYQNQSTVTYCDDEMEEDTKTASSVKLRTRRNLTYVLYVLILGSDSG